MAKREKWREFELLFEIFKNKRVLLPVNIFNLVENFDCELDGSKKMEPQENIDGPDSSQDLANLLHNVYLQLFVEDHDREHWWICMTNLLDVIWGQRQQNSLKYGKSDNVLRECVAHLLEIATNDTISAVQANVILNSLNRCLVESTWTTRANIADRLQEPLLKLSKIMATCGHYPLQMSALECYLRLSNLTDQTDKLARVAAAKIWLTRRYYSQKVINTFTARQFRDLVLDSRRFLNALNESNGRVYSVRYDELTPRINNAIDWMDLNFNTRSLTILYLESNGHTYSMKPTTDVTPNTLIVTPDNVNTVTLSRELTRMFVTITVKIPADVAQQPTSFDFSYKTLKIRLVQGNDYFVKLNRALRVIFPNQYQINPMLSKEIQQLEWDQQRKRSGMMTLSQQRSLSVSSASTTSLAQLPGMLAGLIPHAFEKSRAIIQRFPGVCSVSETASTRTLPKPSGTESYAQTLALRQFQSDDNSAPSRVCREYTVDTRNTQSENECTTRKWRVNLIRDSKIESMINTCTSESGNKVMFGNNAMVVINSDIMDTRVQLALTAKSQCKDSGVITGHQYNDDVIQATIETDEIIAPNRSINVTYPVVNGETPQHTKAKGGNVIEKVNKRKSPDSNKVLNKKGYVKVVNMPQDVIDKLTSSGAKVQKKVAPKGSVNKITKKSSTSGESNTSVISNTPMMYVNVSKRNVKIQRTAETINEDDETHKDHFFTSRFNDLSRDKISPTRARQINETSSDNSDEVSCIISNQDLNDYFEQLLNNDVMECVNDLVDQVCELENVVQESVAEQCALRKVTDKNKGRKKFPKNNLDENPIKALKLNKLVLEQVVTTAKDHSSTADTPTDKNTGNKRTPYIRKPEDGRTIDADIWEDEPLSAVNNKIPNKCVVKPKNPGMKIKFKTQQNRDIKNPVKASKITKVVKKQVVQTTVNDSGRITAETNKRTPLVRQKRKLYSPKDDEKTHNDSNPVKASKITKVVKKQVEQTTVNDSGRTTVEANKRTPLVRQKRKLYSPKDDEKTHNDSETSSNEPLSMIRKKLGNVADQKKDPKKRLSPKTPSCAICYEDIEKDQQNYRKRPRRLSKLNGHTTVSISPRTNKNNDIFDSLQTNIEGVEKLTFIDKKSLKDLAVYNFTSSSGDEDLTKKMSSTTLASESSVKSICPRRTSKKEKNVARTAIKKGKNYGENTRAACEVAKPGTKKPAKGRGPKKQSTRCAATTEREVLQDERMRIASKDDSNTSLIVENQQDNQDEDLDPKINKPVLSQMDLTMDYSEGSVSPLPGLVVETIDSVPHPCRNDADDSVMSSNLMQKVTNVCTNTNSLNGNDSTQNRQLDDADAGDDLDFDFLIFENEATNENTFTNYQYTAANIVDITGQSGQESQKQLERYSYISDADDARQKRITDKNDTQLTSNMINKNSLKLKKDSGKSFSTVVTKAHGDFEIPTQLQQQLTQPRQGQHDNIDPEIKRRTSLYEHYVHIDTDQESYSKITETLTSVQPTNKEVNNKHEFISPIIDLTDSDNESSGIEVNKPKKQHPESRQSQWTSSIVQAASSSTDNSKPEILSNLTIKPLKTKNKPALNPESPIPVLSPGSRRIIERMLGKSPESISHLYIDTPTQRPDIQVGKPSKILIRKAVPANETPQESSIQIVNNGNTSKATKRKANIYKIEINPPKRTASRENEEEMSKRKKDNKMNPVSMSSSSESQWLENCEQGIPDFAETSFAYIDEFIDRVAKIDENIGKECIKMTEEIRLRKEEFNRKSEENLNIFRQKQLELNRKKELIIHTEEENLNKCIQKQQELNGKIEELFRMLEQHVSIVIREKLLEQLRECMRSMRKK